MRPQLISGVLGLASVAMATAATIPLYRNSSAMIAPPAIPPQIDAVAFVNESTFTVDRLSVVGGLSYVTSLPYETANTRFFTNTYGGVISGYPGYRFDLTTNGFRFGMNSWVNQGSISGDTYLLVNATNMVNSGPLTAGPGGILQLRGRDLNLSRSGIRSGTLPGTLYGDGFLVSSNQYSNASGVSDVWWGVGTNNYVTDQGRPMFLNSTNPLVPPVFDLPNLISPLHQVIEAFSGFRFTNLVTLPYFNSSYSFGAFVYTNTLSPTSRVVQVVFIPTNYFDTNFSSAVRFYPDFSDGGATVVVEFRAVDFDIVNLTYNTNTIYFIDNTAFDTNIVLLNNYYGTTRRPDTMEIARNPPFEFLLGVTNNFPFSHDLIYNPSYLSNTVVVNYAAYAATITSGSATNTGGTVFSDPTNYPGRVEIIGDRVNLNQTRIRAETTISIKAGDVVSNKLATVDAPYCNYDLGSTQSPFIITNLVPPAVRRLTGQLAAWTAIWNNTEVTATETNLVRFQVLIVDSYLSSLQPVYVYDFAVRATNVVLADNLNIQRSARLDAQSVHVTGAINFPPRWSWASSNVLNTVNFTNDGSLSIPQAAYYGTDRTNSYRNFVNNGTNVASAHFVRATNIVNTGVLVGNAGLVTLEAPKVSLLGAGAGAVTTNIYTNYFFIGGILYTNIYVEVLTNFSGALIANSDVQIYAGQLVASNSFILAGSNAPGTLVLAITNRVDDGAPNGTNLWVATAGFQMRCLPATGNLLNTYLSSLASRYSQEAFHTWCGQDRGATNPAGFSNNLALGKLTLKGTNFTSMRFAAPDGAGARALYADYLELLDNLTNVNAALAIEPNFRIYFAGANIPAEKLDGAAGGRLRWVPSFAGPLSSTNIVYPSGTIVHTNAALAASRDIDSDEDGIVNGDDPTPFFIPESADLRIARTKGGQVSLSWNALGRSQNVLEYKSALGGAWQTLTNFLSGPATARAFVTDSATRTNQCLYRVRVTPQR